MADIDVKEEKSNNVFKYIVLFILFLGIGVGLGIFGAKKYLDNKKSEDEPIIQQGPEDITDVDEYKQLVNKLHGFVNQYSLFYSTKGLEASKMSNLDRLVIVYDYAKSNAKTVEDKLTAVLGTKNCLDRFALDDPSANAWNTNYCTVNKVDIKLLQEYNKNLFNDDLINTNVEFINSEGKLCIIKETSYVCGNRKDAVDTGKLEVKFDIVKVTKDEGTIVIYDKGYLLDNRTSTIMLNDGHDKHYLHSADSNEFYYELKSADNLTFKHTFITTDRVNYYYVSTELVKE